MLKDAVVKKNISSKRRVNSTIKKDANTNLVTKAALKAKPTERDAFSNKSAWMEDYQDFFAFKQQPINEAFLERLGQELIIFAETHKGILRHEWFFTSKRIPLETVRRWVLKYPNFGNAFNTAKYIIGMRREDGALKKEFNEKIYLQSAQRYDAESIEDAKFHAKIRQEVESSLVRPQVIVIDKLFEDKET